jgi:hypothetical protein
MKPQDLQTLAAAALTAPSPMRWNDSGEPAQPAAVTAAAAIAAKVDRLGAMHAAIASMKREADQIRAELEDAGLTDIEGQPGISRQLRPMRRPIRAYTDWQAIAQRHSSPAPIVTNPRIHQDGRSIDPNDSQSTPNPLRNTSHATNRPRSTRRNPGSNEKRSRTPSRPGLRILKQTSSRSTGPRTP